MTQSINPSTEAPSLQLFDIANELHGEFDKQTYDEKRRADFDLPDDHEFDVRITAKQERALSRAIIRIERLDRAPTEAPSTAQLLRLIEGLSAGWDEHGSTGPREPYSWETVARMAMDYARAALSTPAAEPSSDTPRPVQPAEGGSGPLLDDEGRAMVGASHHYTAENIRSVIADLKECEQGKEVPEWVYRDHRARCGILWRIIAGLAADVPLASPPPEAQAPSEPVLWQWRWTNPGGYENQPDEMLAWKLLDPSPGQTVQQRIDELLAYRHKGEPCYEVRALYAAPVSEQDKRDVLLLDAKAIIECYAQEKPKWTDILGREQDPCGAHRWLEQVAALS